MTDLKSLLPDELEEYVVSLGEPRYRAKQLFGWFAKGAESFEQMSDLPKAFRDKLSEDGYVNTLRLLKKQVSALDGTVKYLWRLRDGNAVETVLMRYKHGNSVCISSQVGCRQGCVFCASAIGGLVRNLTASEMLDEVIYSERDSGEKISNIVIMGIGEPLDNFDNAMRFLRLVNRPEGMNIGMRHISLSTCGITERFEDLSREDMQITLAVSLHAPDDETRSRIMPANRNRGVAAVIEACQAYSRSTGRRVTFEYAMIDRVNDSPEQASRLASAAKKAGAHVNLIPLNHVRERQLRPSAPERMERFRRVLDAAGVNYTVRRRLGGDVDASCGQLRRSRELEERRQE